MTIRQLKEPCWVLDPELPGDDEGRHAHYDGRADALRAVKESKEYGYDDLKSAPRQLEGRCWVVQCDGECEQVIDQEDEGWTIHHSSPQGAEGTVVSWRWVYSPDGRLVFCPECAPEDYQVPQLTPAELEAAGQMRLPGVA